MHSGEVIQVTYGEHLTASREQLTGNGGGGGGPLAMEEMISLAEPQILVRDSQDAMDVDEGLS